MNLFQRITNAYKGFKGVPYDLYGQNNPLVAATWDSSSTRFDMEEQLENYISWVYAAVHIISKASALARFRLYRGTGQPDEAVEVSDHPIVSLLDSPNPFETKYELIYRLSTHLNLTGNCYWYLAKDKMDRIAEIWTLQPDTVTIKTHPTRFISGYEVTNTGKDPIPFTVEDIIHYLLPDPVDPYYGASPVKAAAYSVDTNTYQLNYQRLLYKNNAIPPAVLSTDSKLDDKTMQRLRQSWEKLYGESGTHRNKVAVLEQGLKFSGVGINPRDLDWMSTNGITRDGILAIYGVPPAMLGIVEDVNRANGETQEYTFHRQVIEPLLTMIDAKLTKDLARKYGEKLFIKHDSTIPQEDLRAAQAARERIYAGMTTPNDEAQALGWPAISNPLASETYMMTNMLPLSMVGKKPEDQSQEDDNGTRPNNDDTGEQDS